MPAVPATVGTIVTPEQFLRVKDLDLTNRIVTVRRRGRWCEPCVGLIARPGLHRKPDAELLAGA